MTDDEIVAIAEAHGLCTIVRDAGYPLNALWFDGDCIPFARAIIAASKSKIITVETPDETAIFIS